MGWHVVAEKGSSRNKIKLYCAIVSKVYGFKSRQTEYEKFDPSGGCNFIIGHLQTKIQKASSLEG